MEDNPEFTHKLYTEEGPCVLLRNSKFIVQDIPDAICWMFKNDKYKMIRMSSCLDAKFYPSKELLKQLGY